MSTRDWSTLQPLLLVPQEGAVQQEGQGYPRQSADRARDCGDEEPHLLRHAQGGRRAAHGEGTGQRQGTYMQYTPCNTP